MLSVIDIKRTTQEPVIGFDESKLSVDEELNENYSLSFEITLNNNDDCFELLQMENFLQLDENGQEYRIKSVNRVPRRKQVTKSVSANHVFFDIIAVKQDKSTAINGSRTFEVIMNYALKGTCWTWQVAEGSTFYALTYENFQGNALDLFNKLQERHSFEWYPDSSTKTVYLSKRIGVDTDEQIRYKHNMINIKDDSNTNGITNIRKGYGKKKEFASGQEPAVYKDSDYVTVVIWKDEASIAAYGERWGDDFENETFTQASSLLEAIAADEKSKPWPEVSLTLSYASLREYGQDVPIEATALGNRLFVIHEPLNLDVQARVLKRKWFPLSKTKKPDLTIGSLKPSAIRQNTKARRAVISTERRLLNNENAVRIASANVQKALNDLAASQGDLNELSSLIVQLQAAIEDLETSVPPDVQYQLDALRTLVSNLSTQVSDLDALVFAHEQLLADLADTQDSQATLIAGLQTQIDELKGA